jgi:hypothetical protein
MSELNNNNFAELKRVLKLKQHEVPPPGYFHHFSADVIARIRVGEGSPQGLLERVEPGSWLAHLISLFQAKPGMVGGLATSMCLLLLVGVVMADHNDDTASANDMAVGQPSLPNVAPTLASAMPLAPAGPDSGIAISTNPAAGFAPAVTMFGSQQNPLFQSAAFMPASQ